MAITLTYNADTVIMWSNTTTTRHFLRTNESGSSHTTIVDTTSITKASASSYWSKTSTTGMTSGSPYAANYANGTTWAEAYTFTASGTLYSSSDMFTITTGYDSSTETAYARVNLKGWSFASSSSSYGAPNVTVTCYTSSGTKFSSVTKTLTTWESATADFTGLSCGTTYTFTAVVDTPGYTMGSTSVTTPYKVTYNHYTGSTYYKHTTEAVSYYTNVILANKTIAISDYKYSYATVSGSTTHITSKRITANTTFDLYYIPGTSNVGWWVYTSSGWVKAIPYIYTSSGWVQYKPCLYNSGWIVGT